MSKTPSDEPLRWDYTLTSLEKLTHEAVKFCLWRHLAWQERYEAAYSAIAIAMFSSEEYVRPGELIRLGAKAIERDVLERFQMRGVHRTSEQVTYRKKFMAFWWTQGAPTPSPEDHIVDRIAVRQIFDQLSYGRRRALMALAVHEDYAAAAKALGVSPNAFKISVARGRTHFFRLWHEGEKPARIWGADIRPKTPRTKSITYTTIRERRKTRERRKANPR